MKRVFKIKTFDRWARKVLSDALLCQVAVEIEQGLFEADLGGGVCKKRVPVPGKGKSGSTRTLVAKKHKGAIFFGGCGRQEAGRAACSRNLEGDLQCQIRNRPTRTAFWMK